MPKFLRISLILSGASALILLGLFYIPSSVVAQTTCGSNLTDTRDGKVYTTVLIGTQCWMAKNMNVGTHVADSTAQTDNSIIEKYCYGNSTANCDTDGGLYQWREATQYDATIAGAQGICPTGWHIPTDAELYTLENYLKDSGQACSALRGGWGCATAGTKLKLGGTSGFNAVLAGFRGELDTANGPYYYGRMSAAAIWASNSTGDTAPARYLESVQTNVNRGANNKGAGFSVRCLQGTILPSAPTNVIAVAGNEAATTFNATITFTVPTYDGGSAIQYYTAISNPGNIRIAGSTSPITVGGLTKGTAYTFTVIASNAVGTGSASIVSNSVGSLPPNTISFYKHAEYRKIPLTVNGVSQVPTFVCNPFNSNTNFSITSDNINWQGQHATKEEAVAATIASLESCLSANEYITPLVLPSSSYPGGYGLYPANSCYGYPANRPNKAWVYKDAYQIARTIVETNSTTGAWEYRYTGTARQVTYGNLTYYNSQEAIDYRAGGTSNICRTGIYPENVVLYTTICDETALSNCSVIDSVVPTSQFITYEVDLKVNGFDNTAVDPGSNVNLSWSTTDPAVTSCVASVDWSGNKELGGAQSEIIPVTPANIPAYSYYQGIVYGTPSSRSADCTSGTEGCSAKPHFYCSPWVNSSGAFIDSPLASTHINYQGNYATIAAANEATKASLGACLKTNNYGRLSNDSPYYSEPSESSFYVGTFSSGIYRGGGTTGHPCRLGNTSPLSSDSGDYWIYKGNLAFTGASLDQCKYSGVFEEIKYSDTVNINNIPFNKVYMSSSDCTPDTYGYKPTIDQCSSVNQQVIMAQKVDVPAVIFDNSGSSKTYTLTCDYPGGKVSDTVMININSLSVPGAPQINSANYGPDAVTRLPQNTVTWTPPDTPLNSPILNYEIVKYNSCVSNKTDSDIVADIAANPSRGEFINALLPNYNANNNTYAYEDSWFDYGKQYVYAVRAKNKNGAGHFKVSGCITVDLVKTQLFTISGSGFKDGMDMQLKSGTNIIDCVTTSVSNTALEANCDIKNSTPTGNWSIQVCSSGCATNPSNVITTSKSSVFLRIDPGAGTLAPSDISFTPTSLSVQNGFININSISGNNIAGPATVKLVSAINNVSREINCDGTLSKMLENTDLMKLDGTNLNCGTDNLKFNIEGTTDWKVVVKDRPEVGLSSLPASSISMSLTCVPNCTNLDGTNKVCGDNQCGGSCDSSEGVIRGTATIPWKKSCTNTLGNCSIAGTKNCVGGTYDTCNTANLDTLITSYDPALNTFCDSKSVTTNCGTTVDKLGTLPCTWPRTCGGGGTANACGCTVSSYDPALNTFCDSKSVTTNCGTIVPQITGTLPLASDQVCFNGSSCTPIDQVTACDNKCDIVSNGCGGTYVCDDDGACSGTKHCTIKQKCCNVSDANGDCY